MLTMNFFYSIQTIIFKNESNLIESFELPKIQNFSITPSKHTIRVFIPLILFNLCCNSLFEMMMWLLGQVDVPSFVLSLFNIFSFA